MTKPGRNDPCPCGSGKKYKKCCEAMNKPQALSQRTITQVGVEQKVASIGQLFQSVMSTPIPTPVEKAPEERVEPEVEKKEPENT